MSPFIALPIARDAQDAEDQSFEVMRAAFPTWRGDVADPGAVLLRAGAVMYADVAELATRMGEEAFRYYGRSLAGVPPVDEHAATGQVIFTATNADGPYTVPDATELAGRNSVGELVAFYTLGAEVIPNGATTVIADVEAREEGTHANGISGDAEPTEFLDFLESIEFVAPTDGGTDREADPVFLDRLTEELALSSPKPWLAADIATLARRVPSVFRAMVLDNYKPGPPFDATPEAEDVPLVATVFPVTEAGGDVGVDALADVVALFAALIGNPQNGRVYAANPTRTPVDVAFTATAYPGEDPVATHAAAIEQLTDFLSDATWGMRRDAGEAPHFLYKPTVRRFELASVLEAIESLDHVDTLTLALGGNALGVLDLALPGRAPLPTPGNITGVVSAG